MFTPQEVSEKTFPKSSSFSSGYDLASVDEFLATLTEDYTALYKENAALKTKLKILAEKVEEYRATEDTMRSMLLAAQKLSASMTDEAKANSDKRRQDTRQESERILTEAKNAADVLNRDLAQKTEEAREKYRQAKEAMDDFIARNLAMCRQQAELLEKLPRSRPGGEEEPAEGSAQPDAPAAEETAPETAAPAEDAPTEAPAAPEPAEEVPAAAQDEAQQTRTFEPVQAETDFRSEFKLDLGELKFGRNYDPGK